MDNKVLLRINGVIKHIDMVIRDTKDLNYEDFEKSDLLVRATCFSICQIGEIMTKIAASLEEKYPNVPWSKARGMRNFLIRDYDNVDNEEVYVTIKNDLPILKELFLNIKKELKNK